MFTTQTLDMVSKTALHYTSPSGLLWNFYSAVGQACLDFFMYEKKDASVSPDLYFGSNQRAVDDKGRGGRPVSDVSEMLPILRLPRGFCLKKII